MWVYKACIIQSTLPGWATSETSQFNSQQEGAKIKDLIATPSFCGYISINHFFFFGFFAGKFSQIVSCGFEGQKKRSEQNRSAQKIDPNKAIMNGEAEKNWRSKLKQLVKSRPTTRPNLLFLG